MRKILLVLAAVALALGAAGCSGSSQGASPRAQETPEKAYEKKVYLTPGTKAFRDLAVRACNLMANGRSSSTLFRWFTEDDYRFTFQGTQYSLTRQVAQDAIDTGVDLWDDYYGCPRS